MRTVGPGAVEDGAGTHRQFGRLAFFVNYAAIRQQIKVQIEEVLAYATEHAAEVSPDRIEVVIVTSLAGGTGSGIFLDVAYLVRDLLSHPDYDALRIKHVTIVAFLPEMFRNAGESLLPRLRQNAYAALLELEYYGTPRTVDALYLGEETQAGRDGRHGFRATWPGRGEVFFADRGWDTLFLVNNVNNLTRADPLTDAEVFQMTADYLFLDFGHSRFATEKRTAQVEPGPVQGPVEGDVGAPAPRPGGHPGGRRRGRERLRDAERLHLQQLRAGRDLLRSGQPLPGGRLSPGLATGPVALDRLAAEHPQNVLQEWATRDLLYPQRLADQAEPPPSFHPDAIARRAVVSNDRDWLALLESDLQYIEQKEGEEAAAELGSIVGTHRDRLAAGGEARNTIAQNVATWTGTPTVLGPWRRRLQFLGDRHLSEHGVEATKLILAEYRDTLLDVRQHLVEAQPGNWARRSSPAWTRPGPSRSRSVRSPCGSSWPRPVARRGPSCTSTIPPSPRPMPNPPSSPRSATSASPAGEPRAGSPRISTGPSRSG